MRYTGHKSINNVQILDDGEYIAAIYNTNPNLAYILPMRDNIKIDDCTYSDAAGNIEYEVSVFRIRIKNGKIRRV